MKNALLALVVSAFAAMPVNAQQDTAPHSVTGSGMTGTAAGDVSIPTKNTVGRIIGFLDAETGLPVSDLQVIDSLAGNYRLTSPSGLVGLASFKSQNDSSFVKTHKDGYKDTTFLAMQNDTVPITMLLERAVVLSTMEIKADVPKAARSEIESIAINTNAQFIPPGVLRSPAFEGKSLADAVHKYGFVGRFPTKYDKKPEDRRGTPMNPGMLLAGASPVDCTVKIVLNGSVAAGEEVTMDDQAAMYDGALFYPKGHVLPEEFKKFKGCDGTLILQTMGR